MKILVKAHTDGYRRAGTAFTREGVVIDSTLFSEEQLQAIRTDPHLIAMDQPESESESTKSKGTK
jgi:hypothetical protein